MIPPDFETELLEGRQATVQWLYNAQFSSHAGSLLRDVRTVSTDLVGRRGADGAWQEGRLRRAGQRTELEPIHTQLNSLYNENLSYEAFLTLALMPSMLQIFIVIAVVTTIGRELRDGTVPQWLFIGQGQLVARGGRQAAVSAGLRTRLLALLYLLFFSVVRGWAVAGSLPGLLLAMLLLVLAYCGLGLLLIASTLSLRLSLSGHGVYHRARVCIRRPGIPADGHAAGGARLGASPAAHALPGTADGLVARWRALAPWRSCWCWPALPPAVACSACCCWRGAPMRLPPGGKHDVERLFCHLARHAER